MKREILLASVTGPDKPGITAHITNILAQHEVTILDIGQSVIHNTLNMAILMDIPSHQQSTPVVKELLFAIHQLHLSLTFTPIDNDDYSSWVQEQGKPRYIISLLGRKISAEHISSTTAIIKNQGLNIDMIHRLSGRIPLEEEESLSRACIELSVRGTPADEDEMKKEFMELSHELPIDIAFQVDDIYRRNRRLVCFDMDSTLIQTEVIDELARQAGVGEEVKAITESAMRGELDFSQSLTERVSLLKGLKEEVIEEIAHALPITEGARLLIRTLKQYGYRTAIISGGFHCFGRHLQELLGIDYVFTNTLEIDNGTITGNILGSIVDGKMKVKIMKDLANQEMIHLEQVIAVGDGANDLPMLSAAGLGIAFHAKPVVRQSADHSISTMGLDGILYLLGFRDREVVHHVEIS